MSSNDEEREMIERMQAASRLVAESAQRVAHAMRTGDESSLTTYDRSAYSWELSRAGKWVRAEAVARSIDDDEDERAQALAALSQQLAEAGELSRAETIAHSFPCDPSYGAFHEKVVALIRIAKGFADQGRPDESKRVLADVLPLVRTLGEDGTWEEAGALLEVGDTWIALGYRDKAEAIWNEGAVSAKKSSHFDPDSRRVLKMISDRLSASH